MKSAIEVMRLVLEIRSMRRITTHQSAQASVGPR
jgi:hypothetical protein